MTITDRLIFLDARIREEYARERGDAAEGTFREIGARMRANMRRYQIRYGFSLRNGRLVSTASVELEHYVDHPDYRPDWRP